MAGRRPSWRGLPFNLRNPNSAACAQRFGPSFSLNSVFDKGNAKQLGELTAAISGHRDVC